MEKIKKTKKMEVINKINKRKIIKMDKIKIKCKKKMKLRTRYNKKNK